MQTKLGTFTSRKIEARMCAAVYELRAWHEDNTRVEIVIDPETKAAHAVVSLHGHIIARYFPGVDGSPGMNARPKLEVNEMTLAAWPTNTTKSRLRALGADIQSIRGVLHLNGKPFDWEAQ